ncbi:hypothetical protein V6N12_062495 [Hibiscus sabdariffa]|uniref:Uncharacterized protein n=1 Tax=Hibiscus sabdariffa TaxID=183260 RepID=A0ABR2F915_9ROSI
MSSNERTTLQPQDAVQQAMERFQGQMVVQKISETDGSSSILQLSGFPSKTRTIQWLPKIPYESTAILQCLSSSTKTTRVSYVAYTTTGSGTTAFAHHATQLTSTDDILRSAVGVESNSRTK